MSGVRRKVIFGAIVAAGVVSAAVLVRNLGCGCRRAPRVVEPRGREWSLPFRCKKCGHEFVGYEVGLVPGTKARDRELRYRRPADEHWVPGTDKPGVAKIKSVVCPKCGADMRNLTLLDAGIAAPAP